MRAVFEIRPPEWAETLAVLQSVSLADVQSDVRARVVDVAGERVTIDLPALEGETSAEQLLAGPGPLITDDHPLQEYFLLRHWLFDPDSPRVGPAQLLAATDG